MTEILISGASFAAVGVLAGVSARPSIGLVILTAMGAAIAGAAFLPDAPDVYEEMDPKNQALLAAIMFGVPALVGWIAGALIRRARSSS
jgi:ABC-type branched-subunit amino acid transport system permease subunit